MKFKEYRCHICKKITAIKTTAFKDCQKPHCFGLTCVGKCGKGELEDKKEVAMNLILREGVRKNEQ